MSFSVELRIKKMSNFGTSVLDHHFLSQPFQYMYKTLYMLIPKEVAVELLSLLVRTHTFSITITNLGQHFDNDKC